MYPRAAVSTALLDTPGRIVAMARRWASGTTAYTVRNLSDGFRPPGNVTLLYVQRMRVKSLL